MRATGLWNRRITATPRSLSGGSSTRREPDHAARAWGQIPPTRWAALLTAWERVHAAAMQFEAVRVWPDG